MESLGIDIKLLTAQIINFLILFFVLKKVLYRPLINSIDERNKRIEDSVTNSKKIEERLAKIESKEKEIVEKAEAKGKKQREEIIQMANNEKARIIEESKLAAKREVEKGIAEIKNQESETAKLLTSEFMDKLVDKLHNKIISDTKKGRYPILGKLIKK